MYAIMTTHGHVQTTRRKVILHAARAKSNYSIASPDYALTSTIQAVRKGCPPRGYHPKPQTTAFHRLYLRVRLSAHKLSVGIKAIKSQISLTGQDAEYKITDDFKNCWVIRRTTHVRGAFTSRDYLVSHHKGRPIKVKILPSTSGSTHAN